jgi:arylsulfatase A-like enzyme
MLPAAITDHPPPPRAVRLLVVVAMGVALGACGERSPVPHLVLVSVDTLRSDALRAYDPAAPPLPEIDTLAARGARFTQALAPAAWTLPSHASLLTGVYPARHGAVHKKTTIAATAPPLASLLAARGYETAAFTDGGFLDASYGFARGFRRYDDRTSAGAAPLAGLPRGGRPGPEGQSDLFARAEAFLARRRSDEPLFLFAHTYAVHDYYRARSTARAAYNLECLLGQRRCAAADWAALAAAYRAEVRRLDGALGTLLAAVDRALADRPTFVVLLSDHGEGLDPARGVTHHGGALRRELLAVPLLVAGPGIEARAVETPVSLVDVAPTLLALAGGSRWGRDRFDGRSLLPLLDGGARARLARLTFAGRGLRAEEHFFWWRDGSRRAARDVVTRPLAVGVLHDGWWYTRAPHRELAERLAAGPADRPPLPALRRAARPLLRTRAAATEPRADSAELDAALRALGYGGGGAP